MSYRIAEFNSGGSRKPLNIITKRSILDVAAVLDPPLVMLKLETAQKMTVSVKNYFV